MPDYTPFAANHGIVEINDVAFPAKEWDWDDSATYFPILTRSSAGQQEVLPGTSSLIITASGFQHDGFDPFSGPFNAIIKQYVKFKITPSSDFPDVFAVCSSCYCSHWKYFADCDGMPTWSFVGIGNFTYSNFAKDE